MCKLERRLVTMKRHFMNKAALLLLTIIGFSFMSLGCAAFEDSGEASPDYEKTKDMMIDMLQTEEGKQAIREVLQDEEVKEQLLMEQEFIEDTIQQTLASEEGKMYWEQVMKDPEFSKTFATSMQEENEALLKGLMKDPEYQGMMVEIMQNPELEDNYLDLIKTKNYRQEVMNIVTEAMESPLFIARINGLLEEIAKNELQSSSSNEDSESGDDGSSGSGSSPGDRDPGPGTDEESEDMG